MSKENQNGSEEKVSIKTKISSGLSSGIDAIDSRTNPVVGKYLYVIFKWTTVALFFLVLPLFILFFQFAATEDGYVFTYDSVVVSDSVWVNAEVSDSHDYQEIDAAIDLIYENRIEESIFSKVDESTGIYFYYGVAEGGYQQWASTLPDPATAAFEGYVTASQTWWETVSDSTADQATLFGTWIAAKTTTDEDDTAETYANDKGLAKTKFREFYEPTLMTNNDEDILNIWFITGWVIVGVGVITSILWFWFSKFSEVPLSDKAKDKKGDKE